MSERTRLLAALLSLGALLMLTSVQGVFAVDEEHYLASLRALARGRVTVPDFDGLEASPKLAYFDAAIQMRPRGFRSTNVPPLYAVIALPFYWLGWWALIALNIIAFLACGALVFYLAKRHSSQMHTPWLALGVYAAGGFSLEYAAGMWPHMLSVALCSGALYLAGSVRHEGKRTILALAAGLLSGLAMGVRYQNVVFCGALGLGLSLFGKARLRSSLSYGLGLAGPLLASSIFNHYRLGSYNPISKGPGYFSVEAGNAAFLASPDKGNATLDALLQPFAVFWAKVVDFSTHPPLPRKPSHNFFPLQHQNPKTGAYLYLGRALKKALLQSSPWVLLAITFMALAWRKRGKLAAGQRQELRALSLIVTLVFAAFAIAGFGRIDGLCFNQRYFLELLPIFAVALAWAMEQRRWASDPLLNGGLAGAALVVALLSLFPPTSPIRQLALLKIPLLLAVGAAFLWALGKGDRWQKPLLVAVGLCLGWSLFLHVGDDLITTRMLRSARRGKANAVAKILPAGPAAIFASGDEKDGLGPLQLSYDLLIVNPEEGRPEETTRLVDALFRTKRRVFALTRGMPRSTLQSITSGRRPRIVARKPLEIVEIQ